jgi:predicted O-methyltransferase YrrM
VTLAERYQRACQTPSDIFEHLPVFVDLCEELEATKVIELGTRGGVSTIAWLYGLEGVGRLWSVDIDPAPELPYDHWTFLLGDDLDPQIVKQLPDSADIVFIDTSHTYEQTLSELNVYVWKVRPGGKIVMHDSELRRVPARTRQPDFPVKVAVEEFCNEEGLTVQYLPNNNGLAIISIPQE